MLITIALNLAALWVIVISWVALWQILKIASFQAKRNRFIEKERRKIPPLPHHRLSKAEANAYEDMRESRLLEAANQWDLLVAERARQGRPLFR